MLNENITKKNKIQKEIIKTIKENGDIDKYEISDTLSALACFIEKYPVKDNKEELLFYSHNINGELIEYFCNNQLILEEFYHMLDVLKNKLSNLSDKDNFEVIEERKIIKKIQNDFKNIYKVYGKSESVNKDDASFEIIEYWLQSEDGYPYIKMLLKRLPKFLNVYKDEKHIVIHIIDLYIENFKKMIVDKNSDYINKNHLSEVYSLFTSNFKLNLSKNEEALIDEKLEEFVNYLKGTLIKQSRRNLAIKETRSLKTDRYYYPKKEYEPYSITDDYLYWNKQQIVNSYKDHLQRHICDSKVEKVFLMRTDNFAYSIKEQEGHVLLRFHSFDASNFISENSEMYRYFANCIMNKEKIDSFISKSFRFKKNELYPVITYQLKISNSGVIQDLNITKNVVEVNDRYWEADFSQKKLQLVFDIYKKVLLKNGGYIEESISLDGINSYFENILNEKFVEYVQNNNLPFIYYGIFEQDEKEVLVNKNNISPILSKLDKIDFERIHEFISKNVDEYHYSNEPIENGSYKLNLLDSFNYLGLETSKMLSDFVFNQRNLDTDTAWQRMLMEYQNKNDKKVKELNSNLNYVDKNLMKMNKGKIKIKKSSK